MLNIDKVTQAMMDTEQMTGLSVFEHGVSVNKKFIELYNYLYNNEPLISEWKLIMYWLWCFSIISISKLSSRTFAALATMAGLPAGVLGVYISINTLCDMGATCVNVIGDMACRAVLKNVIKVEEEA